MTPHFFETVFSPNAPAFESVSLTLVSIWYWSAPPPRPDFQVCELIYWCFVSFSLQVFLMLGVLLPMLSYSSFYFIPRIKQTNDTLPWTPLENISEGIFVESQRYSTSSYHRALTINQSLHTRTCYTTPKAKIDSTTTFWIVLMIAFVARTFAIPFNNIMDASSQKLAKQHNAQFGRQRLWGGVAWGIWSPIAGLAIDAFHPTPLLSNQYTLIFIMFIVLMLLTIPSVLMIILPPHERPQSVSRNVCSIFLNPLLVMFLMCCLVCGIVFGIISTYLFIFLEDQLDGPHYLMGLTLTLTCIAEVPVMFYAKRLLDLLGHINVMNLVVITWGLRSFLYSTLQSPYWVLPIELLHGITFGLFFPALTSFVNWVSPEGTQTTVQALCMGAYTGLGKFLCLFPMSFCKNWMFLNMNIVAVSYKHTAPSS